MGRDELTSDPRVVSVALPWATEASSVVAGLGSDPVDGLTVADASARLASIGPNELHERAATPPWRLFLEQFTNAMILVLLGAAAITAALGDLKDTLVILAIVALNGIIGFAQEYRAEQAMDALRRMTSPVARVIREGTTATVPARTSRPLRGTSMRLAVLTGPKADQPRGVQ